MLELSPIIPAVMAPRGARTRIFERTFKRGTLFNLIPLHPNARPAPSIAPAAALPANFLPSSLLPTGCFVRDEIFSSAVLPSARPNVIVCKNP